VEAVIYTHPAVREAAVFGIPDPQWGELVMACVVLKTGATLNADDLIAFCRQSLASYKLPRRIEFSETDLPKNSSGKVLKKTLRERFWTHQQTCRELTRPAYIGIVGRCVQPEILDISRKPSRRSKGNKK
jgi:acyl-CoA synthetase (AMP-forming)/AMP-acid ligase II